MARPGRVAALVGAGVASALRSAAGLAFVPPPALDRAAQSRVGASSADKSGIAAVESGRRAALGLAGAALLPAAAGQPAVATKEPRVTATCELKIKIGALNSAKEKRILIGAFGDEAPVLVRSFMEACSGRYPGEAGSQVDYYLSDMKYMEKGKVISFADFKDGNDYYKQELGKINGFWVKSSSVKRPLAGEDTLTDESNSLVHDQLGRVSMKRGGGTFDFNIAPVANAGWLDKDNVVIGQVLEGAQYIPALEKVPTKDGKPQKKVRIVSSSLSILNDKTGELEPLDVFSVEDGKEKEEEKKKARQYYVPL